MLFEYWKRLDQFDYEILGVEEWWRINTTAQMLTSFEMENKGYFDRADANLVFSKLFDKYEKYIINILDVCSFEINTPSNPLHESYFPKGAILINSLTTTFPQKGFVEVVESDNKLRIDLDKLKRFLTSGDEPKGDTPSMGLLGPDKTTKIPLKDKQPDADLIVNGYQRGDDESNSQVLSSFPENEPKSNEYHFVKRSHFWEIRFGSVTIDGIRKLEGMDYIKVMLQSPYREFGVTELRSLFNPDSIDGKGKRIDGDSCFQKDEEPIGQKHSQADHDNLKNKVLLPYKQQLKKLHADREEAERNANDAEIDRINMIVSMIEEEINNVLRNKNDDPELDKNRRSVWKNINKALECIQAEELARGYNESPIFNHLKKYIETGKTCLYNPPIEDKPDWKC